MGRPTSSIQSLLIWVRIRTFVDATVVVVVDVVIVGVVVFIVRNLSTCAYRCFLYHGEA